MNNQFFNSNAKEIRKKKYYKVVNSLYGISEIHNYHKGLNVYNYKNEESFKFGDGMFMCDIKDLFYYINYGPIVLEISIPEDANFDHVYVNDGLNVYNDDIIVDEYWADKLIVEKEYKLTNYHDVGTLLDLGADPFANDGQLIIWALLNNEEVFSYLKNRYDNNDIQKIINRYYGLF